MTVYIPFSSLLSQFIIVNMTDLSYPQVGDRVKVIQKKHYKTGEKEYERLEKAKQIDKEAAYLATSWGMFRISGLRYKECGFTSIKEFVYNHYQTEKEMKFQNLYFPTDKFNKSVTFLRRMRW